MTGVGARALGDPGQGDPGQGDPGRAPEPERTAHGVKSPGRLGCRSTWDP